MPSRLRATRNCRQPIDLSAPHSLSLGLSRIQLRMMQLQGIPSEAVIPCIDVAAPACRAGRLQLYLRAVCLNEHTWPEKRMKVPNLAPPS